MAKRLVNAAESAALLSGKRERKHHPDRDGAEDDPGQDPESETRHEELLPGEAIWNSHRQENNPGCPLGTSVQGPTASREELPAADGGFCP